MKKNLLSPLPEDLDDEVFEELVRSPQVRIERIVSNGHSSPRSGWYDQDESEWVLVLRGAGAILFEDGEEAVLRAGDSMGIPAHRKHRVLWTDREGPTVWLAVFYRQGGDT
ncbi:cupin [Prosthecochloris sp. GSB1]|uniref:cupin domain-containing protein n=1 Tax=Prosthecochloris sp. GSB1 TaxID=281093 RepID=UPI000B8C7E93|nr:cupin domain-containing protein [Prosthecochloris sp. GSB1]ASQ91608.1 cupin [Prosthecochloris sp. GSB1]